MLINCYNAVGKWFKLFNEGREEFKDVCVYKNKMSLLNDKIWASVSILLRGDYITLLPNSLQAHRKLHALTLLFKWLDYILST